MAAVYREEVRRKHTSFMRGLRVDIERILSDTRGPQAIEKLYPNTTVGI